jgi:hypothetical protein
VEGGSSLRLDRACASSDARRIDGSGSRRLIDDAASPIICIERGAVDLDTNGKARTRRALSRSELAVFKSIAAA